MSAFEVNVTPTRSQPKRRTESREPTQVLLGPFTPKATVIFEAVPIGKTARRQLVVKNPYDVEIKVLVTKMPKPDFNLGLEWTSSDIASGGELQMELVWNPLIPIASKEVLQMSDSLGNKKEISLILKSTELKKAPVKKTLHKKGSVLPKKLKLKSPSPPKAILKRTVLMNKKESTFRKTFQSPPSFLPAAPPVNVLKASNASNIFSTSAFNFSQMSDVVEHGKRGDKENVSPGTPENASKLFNSLKFTPSNATDMSYLADLPTPVNFLKVDDIRYLTTTTIRKRLSISPETNQNSLSPSGEETPRLTIPMNHSVLAMKETPKSNYKMEAMRPRSSQLSLTPKNRSNMFSDTKEFDPNCFSTVTKAVQQEKTYVMVDEVDHSTGSGRHLNFSHELEVTEIQMKDSPVATLKMEASRVMGSTSPCNEIQLVFLESLEQGFSEQPKVLNKTQVVSPYNSNPQLSMIAEESSRELGLTYHADAASAHEPEELKIHQKTFKITSHENLSKSSSDDNIVKNLTMEIKHSGIQGSMPNLNDEEDGARMFNEHEIRAQSSRFNLHEIGRISDEMMKSPGHGGKRFMDRSSLGNDRDDEPLSMQISPPKRSKLAMSASLTSLLTVSSSAGSANSSTSVPKIRVSKPNEKQYFQETRVILMYSEEPVYHADEESCDDIDIIWLQLIDPEVPKSTVPRNLSLKRPPAPTMLMKKFPSEEKRVFLYDSEHHLKTLINPDPFAATTTCDPFLTATMYLDERAFEKYEQQLKKWLNALVTIPADLDTEPNKPLDVVKLFDEVKGKELALAPTKELISSNYYKNRLNQLRGAGISLYLSEYIAEPLRKVRSAIEKKSMVLRSDRDLHLDLVLQRNILELLLCFNPLWLRLGLEVIFGEQIDLQSNRDMVGLSTFIINRLFRDRYLEAKNSKAYSLSPAYAEHMKKYTFRMFLFLLFFLDTAKNRRLIKHNPCLFVKNAPHKETREILIRFSSHLVAGIGDITKHLRRFGYVLSHRQSFLDEFDYAFENLSVDMRDGIRLTRVMEIILLRDDLSQYLRVPTISRLQKIHNVNLALKALEEAEYQIAGDIGAKDICDGHREKTLSLMWQIVYKFRAPKFNAAANVLRNWWKKNWLKVVIGRRIEVKMQKRREMAVIRIQATYRAYRTRQCFLQMRHEKLQAVIILQKYTRRYLAQKHAALLYSSILRIQRWWYSVQQMKSVRERFLLQRKSTILIQTTFRRFILAKRLFAAAGVIREIKAHARLRHEKAIVLQRVLRSFMIHKKLQAIVMGMVTFNRRKAIKYHSAAKIQSFVRMRKVRQEFLELRQATLRIQLRWKQCLHARRERFDFLQQKRCAILIQQRVRGYFVMKATKALYAKQRSTVMMVQRKFRAKLEMRRKRAEYLNIRQAVLTVQNTFKALIAMRKQRTCFQQLRSATIVIQQRFRAQYGMKVQRKEFISLRSATITVQQQFRAQLAMKQACSRYQLVRSSCITIQRRLRATIAMKQQRLKFLTIQYHAIVVQRQFRANTAARKQRQEYIKLKLAAVCVQRKLRATTLALQVQRSYQEKRQAAITVQQYWRSIQLRRQMRCNFMEKRIAAVKIQRYFRGHRLTTQIRTDYTTLRTCTMRIQQRYRATKLMQRQRQDFQDMVRATVVVQRKYRALREARKQNILYMQLRNAVICIQQRWRAILTMRKCRQEYLTIQKNVVNVQIRFRALKLMKLVRSNYQKVRASIVFIQQKYRAKREMERACGKFLNLKSATIIIQQYFRGYLEMKRHRVSYTQLKYSTLCVQRRFRALQQMKAQKLTFTQQKHSAITIQRFFRSYLAMKHHRITFLQVRNACIVLQTRYRSRLAMLSDRQRYEILRSSALLIQQRWRATLTMRIQYCAYQAIISATKTIQIRYRAYRLGLMNQLNYRMYRSAVIVIQRRFRGKLLMRTQRSRFEQLKLITFRLQTRARGFLARRAFQVKLTPEYMERRKQEQAAKMIQACWRGYRHRKRHQTMSMRSIALRMISSRREAARDPSNRVSNILRSCMKFMKTRFAVHEAIKVLLRIEHISRLVPHLLARDAIFLATFCYATMAQAIRSELDKQLIEICARIILNMARFDGTKEEAFQEKGLVTVSQMLLRWCDKECGIFNTLCTLLWILSHNTHKKNAIRRYMISREAIYMLRETKKLVQRKENMRKNVKKPVGCLVPPDPTLMRMVPILTPDYGVIRSKPYVFYSSVFAFDTVLNVLDVDIS